MLAVVHGDAHVLDRKAGERALGEHLAHALLHRRDVLPGDRTAHHVVHELEARAAPECLDTQVHLAELPGAAGLLLVPAVSFGWSRDGLAVRDARRVGLHVHPVALGHALEQHPQVKFTHAVEDGLVRSEEHTSELQSRLHLVCRLLLEKKNTTQHQPIPRAMLSVDTQLQRVTDRRLLHHFRPELLLVSYAPLCGCRPIRRTLYHTIPPL